MHGFSFIEKSSKSAVFRRSKTRAKEKTILRRSKTRAKEKTKKKERKKTHCLLIRDVLKKKKNVTDQKTMRPCRGRNPILRSASTMPRACDAAHTLVA